MIFVNLAAIAVVIVALTHISAWLSSIAESRKIRRYKEEENERRDHYSEDHDDVQKPFSRTIAARMHSISNQLQAQRHQQERHDIDRTFREYVTIFLVLVTSVFTAITVIIFYRQLEEMRVDKRPWLKLVNIDILGVEIQKDQVLIDANFNIRNIGKSPNSAVFVFPSVLSKVDGMLRSMIPGGICEEVKSHDLNKLTSSAVFPDDNYLVHKVESKKLSEMVKGSFFGAYSSIVLAGCVAYKFNGSDEVHVTNFFYEIFHNVDGTMATFDLATPHKFEASEVIKREMDVGKFAD